jgi:hypothetical protein
MTDQPKDWRDAKMPNWAVIAVQAEIDQWRLTAALAWPTRAKPEPLPFWWGNYDVLVGEPREGTFWAARLYDIDRFDLCATQNLSGADRDYIITREELGEWAFLRENSNRWTTTACRGPLFDNEADAKLYRRWLMCEDFARQLMRAM